MHRDWFSLTVEKVLYDNRAALLQDEAQRIRDGWRNLHTEFIDNKIRATWVNGNDDPSNTPEPVTNMTQAQFIKFLAVEFDINLP